ncbi:MAG TPA: MauE/DoxX family redox-associated membrane protein [Catenuloplanes sp.]
MEIVAHAVVTAALGAALLLIAGGVNHLRDRGTFAAVLATQSVVPRRLRGAAATTVAVAETLTAAVAVTAWLAAPRAAAAAFAIVAGCYAALGLYTAVVRVRAPTAPCGCFGTGGPVTPLVVARAWLFAAAAGSAALLAPVVVDIALPARLALLAPAVMVALAGWLVPAVLAPAAPTDSTFRGHPGVVASTSRSRGSEPDAPHRPL